MLRSRAALLALLGAVVPAGLLASNQGCSSPSPTDTTGTTVGDHTVGDILNRNEPFVWARISEAEYTKGLSAPSGGTPVDRNDPAVLRMQQWLDRYHTIVTEMLAAKGQRLGAPKPNAAVFTGSDFPNGWVSAALVCPKWSVRFAGAAPSAAATPQLLLTGGAVQGTDLSARCVTPENWTDRAAFGAYYSRDTPACTLALEGSGFVVAGDSCRSAPGTSQGDLATYAVSNTVSVTLETISWGDEIRAAMTLAHELGHYYRAHTNPLVKKAINFFYQDSPNGPERPVPVAESGTWEGIVSWIRAVPVPMRLTAPTRYSKRLSQLLLNVRLELCQSAPITEPTYKAVYLNQVSQAQLDEWSAFENAIGTCADALPLDDATIGTKFNAILTKLKFSPQWGNSGTPSTPATTVGEYLAKVTTRFDQIDAGEKELLAAVANGLSWYTDEQEADELGLELATRAGFAPADLVTARVKTHEQIEESYRAKGYGSGQPVDVATCKKWLANDFTEVGADGVRHDVRVPLGSLSDAHHADCYRIYNLWREAKRHNYVVAPAMPALTPAWKEVQAHAITLGGEPPPVLPTTTDAGAEAPSDTPKKKPTTTTTGAAPAPLAASGTADSGCSTAPGTPTSAIPNALLVSMLLLARRRRREG